jgi:hypothetical protein
MPNDLKIRFLAELKNRYGQLHKLNQSLSLYVLGENALRIYIRYSKVHGDRSTFYGLREEDLRQLAGHPSLICFLWDGQKEPLFIRFSDYEDVFHSTSPARDGQYKVMIFLQEGATELYIARSGRFNVEGDFGWHRLESEINPMAVEAIPEFTHSQMQTILGAIGAAKGFGVWIPAADRNKLDWSITSPFPCQNVLPYGFQEAEGILQEIDVIWIHRGSSELRALFEVEHSTPIYSGLLRFNDVHLVSPRLRPKFSVVANDSRRDVFVRQLNRPTFRLSGLNELCTFLDYKNVFEWYMRVKS